MQQDMQKRTVVVFAIANLFITAVVFLVNTRDNDHIDHQMAWQNDYASFVESLQTWTLQGVIPSRAELDKKYEQGLCKPFTDGAGGFFDLSPLPGTLQFLVNDYYCGRTVHWKVKVLYSFRDTLQEQLYDQLNPFPTGAILWVIPYAPNTDHASGEDMSLPVLGLIVQQSPDGDIDSLKAGDECLVSGSIADADHTNMLSFSGVNVAYHFELPLSNNIGYIVQVSNAHVTRL